MPSYCRRILVKMEFTCIVWSILKFVETKLLKTKNTTAGAHWGSIHGAEYFHLKSLLISFLEIALFWGSNLLFATVGGSLRP